MSEETYQKWLDAQFEAYRSDPLSIDSSNGEPSFLNGIVTTTPANTSFKKWDMDEAFQLWKKRGFNEISIGRYWVEIDAKTRAGSERMLARDSLFVSHNSSWLRYEIQKDSIAVHGWERVFQREQENAVSVVISHANESLDAKCFVVGSEKFKLQAWEEAFRQGVTILNYTPNADTIWMIKNAIRENRRSSGNPLNKLDLPNYPKDGFATEEQCRRGGLLRGGPTRPAPPSFRLSLNERDP